MGWHSAVIESRTLRAIVTIIVTIVGAIAVSTVLALTGPSFAASDELSDTCARYLEETNDETLAALCEELREESAKFRDVDEAVARGYVAPARPDGSLICVAPLATEGGGMGYHYVHRDDVLHDDPPEVGIDGIAKEPEAVLYDPVANGEVELVAVEWIVRYEGQTKAPKILAESFQGPMAGHEKWMPTHYDLHAWVWKYNESGMFAQYNPAVDCNPSTP